MTVEAFNVREHNHIEELIEMARIRAIQEAICGFLLDEVINPKGEFYDDVRTSVAKKDPTTGKLINYYS
jgi:hypothetical protein